MQSIHRYITIPLTTLLLSASVAMAKDVTGFASTGKTSQHGSHIFVHKIEQGDTIDGIVEGFNHHDDNTWKDKFNDVKSTNLAFSPWKERTDENLEPGEYIYIYAKLHGTGQTKQQRTPKDNLKARHPKKPTTEVYIPPPQRINFFARPQYRDERWKNTSQGGFGLRPNRERTSYMLQSQIFLTSASDENNNIVFKHRVKRGETVEEIMRKFDYLDDKYLGNRFNSIQRHNIIDGQRQGVTDNNIREYVGEWIYISSLQPRYRY